jgi:phosphatidate cytidylyltransferase
MRQRLISAAVLVPVVIVVFLLGQPWLTLGLALLSGFVALEVARLLAGAGFPVEAALLIVAAPLAVLGMGWSGAPADAAVVFVAAIVIIAAIDAFRRLEARDGFVAWMATSFGAIYASLLAFMAGILVIAPPVPTGAAFANVLDAGRVWLLVLVLSVWSFDTFAYLAGRTFKRGHFLNHISPNKTWSGVIGGTVAAVAVAGLLTWAAGQNVLGGLLLGLLVAITAQSGDVAESLLKRAAGAKDSGRLIPGHGGVLDRVDSFLFAAPAVFAYLVILGRLGSPA